MQLIDVWINCPSTDVAERLADDLVEKRLAACANVFGKVQSVYRWQGRIERESEVPLLVKSRAAYFKRLSARVTELHPYDTPAIIAVPILEANTDYSDWLIGETEGAG